MKQSSAQPYERAIEKIQFHNAVLMGMASRFQNACQPGCNDNRHEDDDVEDEIAAAGADSDDDITLMAVMVNDPAARKARELFAAALAREQKLIGQLRTQFYSFSAGHNDNKRRYARHDDRELRPSLMTMNLWGLRGIAVPTAMLN
jgi:hypothetical protein